jgi:hypothetical protein
MYLINIGLNFIASNIDLGLINMINICIYHTRKHDDKPQNLGASFRQSHSSLHFYDSQP